MLHALTSRAALRQADALAASSRHYSVNRAWHRLSASDGDHARAWRAIGLVKRKCKPLSQRGRRLASISSMSVSGAAAAAAWRSAGDRRQDDAGSGNLHDCTGRRRGPASLNRFTATYLPATNSTLLVSPMVVAVADFHRAHCGDDFGGQAKKRLERQVLAIIDILISI